MKNTLIAFMIWLPNIVWSQQNHQLELSFFSDNYQSPGISIAYAKPFGIKHKVKKSRMIDKYFSIGAKISFYSRINNHRAYIILPFIRYERVSNQGIMIQPELGIGYMIKKNQNKTYTIHNNQVEEVEFAAHHRWFITAALGLGYNLGKQTNIPFSIFFRPGIAIEVPNNTSFLPHFQSELGVRYQF